MPEPVNRARMLKYMEELRHLCHEIRQPLTVILLLSETGIERGLENEEANTIYNAGLQSREGLLRIQEILYEWQELEDSELNNGNLNLPIEPEPEKVTQT